MKKVIAIFLLIICLAFTTQSKLIEGTYEYKTENFYESIELKENHRFNYCYRLTSISFTLEGNYMIKGDSLILDSSPQKDKIIVRETKEGNKNNVSFWVADKLGIPLNYTLHVIENDNDTITLTNQWKSSKLKNRAINSFYIVDSKGLKTPLYQIQGTKTNHFEVLMETKRVLDNEIWKITNNTITPIGINGEYQSYRLEKLLIDNK